MHRQVLWRVLVALAVLLALAPAANAQEPRFRALVFSETAGFVHDSVPEARQMWTELAAQHAFEVVQAQDSTPFTDEGLRDFDVIILANASGDVWNASEEQAFERFVRAGGGVVAVHNPLDMEQGNAFYRALIGAEFTAHSAANTQGTLKVVDHDHPSTADVPGSWTRNEEWYGFNKSVRGDKHVLTQLDPTSVPANTPGRQIDQPVTWCDVYEGGRTWITSMGHARSVYSEALFRKHALGGAEWAAGVADGDCKAGDWDNYDKVALDTNTSAPWGIAVAPDGRVFFTELVRGQVRVYDPREERTFTAATIPVYGGGEDGLLGLALDPDFAANHWVYVYYSPEGAAEINRLSRFTMSGNTMDLTTEKVMLEVPASRGNKEIGHTGGTLRFDGQGNLYLSVGDDVNPFESSGYTPIDERPGRAHFDAQGTSANTNDLRGKLLRIKPQPDGTYTIPAGNLFAPGEMGTRPEIYAMGFRNAFRFSVDTDGTVYIADYGPDAGSANPNRGPAGLVEWNVIKRPGNYGWPYCVADNVAYNDYDFATSTSGAKFNCAAPVNDSPNNTGKRELPPSIPSDVFYGYGVSPTWPQLGAGSASPMAGPVYHYDAASPSTKKWPAYFDGKPLFYEWGRNFIQEWPLAADGSVLTMNPVLGGTPFLSPLDLQFGPDGALYLLEWGGGFGRDNPNSGLYRIDYAADGRAPTARAAATPDSGPAPLEVQFSSAGTIDRDGDDVSYRWDFGDGGSSTEANPKHTYTEIGNYEARLTVTEATGSAKTGTATVPIIAGNTRPTLKIDAPPNGGFFDWGDELPWTVKVTDPDEPGDVDCDDVIVQPALGHDDHAHPELVTTACEGTAKTFLDEGHAEANAFWVIDARYTDSGGQGGSQALTASATSVYRPKRFQAHYYDEQDGLAIENNAAAEYGQYVGSIQDGDWLRYDDMNFAGIDGLRYRVSAGPEGGGRIEARLGSPTGELLATTPVNSTGGWFTFVTTDITPIDPPEGTHDIFLVFRSNPGVNWSMTLDVFEAVGEGVGVKPAVDPKAPRIDRETAGDWVGRYGRSGYFIPQSDVSLPTGVTVTSPASQFTWAATSTLPRALQRADGIGRRASTWFHATGFAVDVDFAAGRTFKLDLYFTNYDDNPREQTVRLVKRDGTELAPAVPVTSFGNGMWVGWTIDEPVTVEVRKTGGNNAVMSGVFLTEVDETSPTVNAETVPAANAAGWHDRVPVALRVTGDDGLGSGVDELQYAFGDGPWRTYHDPLAVLTEGATTARFRAIDRAGNVSETGRLEIRVDTVAPTAAAAVTDAGIVITGADALSGLAGLEYALDGGPWMAYTAPIQPASAGDHVLRFRARDVAGNASPAQELRFARAGGDTEVRAAVPATLSVQLDGAAALGPFVPGLARVYNTTTTATVTSTAGDAVLSLADRSPHAPGHLVNGTSALAQPLQVAGGPLGAAAVPLVTYTGPVSNDEVTIPIAQAIGGAEPLRTGTYAKTLTLTLTTTTP